MKANKKALCLNTSLAVMPMLKCDSKQGNKNQETSKMVEEMVNAVWKPGFWAGFPTNDYSKI